MAMITWDASYSVGIEEIDKQHQVLIGIINKLFSCMPRSASSKPT
jgi:hemerythrin